MAPTATATVTPQKLQEDVENLLCADNRIDATAIAVKVDGSRVILSGSVPDYGDRRIAESDAAIVPGVSDVDNHLAVQPVPPGIELPPDDQLRTNVQHALNWNATIDTSGIKVTVKNGVVMLNGVVPSYWQKFRAQELAESLIGVVDVDNSLSINPQKKYEDDFIQQEVSGLLSTNLRENGTSIGATVENGVVTLYGNVPDLSSFRAAENIVSFANGVIAVKNNLIIQPVTEPAT